MGAYFALDFQSESKRKTGTKLLSCTAHCRSHESEMKGNEANTDKISGYTLW